MVIGRKNTEEQEQLQEETQSQVEESCANCLFSRNRGRLYCCWEPPVVLVINGLPRTHQPEVDETIWCVEWQGNT